VGWFTRGRDEPVREGRLLYFVAAVVGLLIVGAVGAAWLAGTIPSRPKGIASNAVFLWALAVGFPGGLPRRGDWLACRENAAHDDCKLSDIDGSTEYEGNFVAYGEKSSLPADQLQIETEKTSENKVWVGSALVPLVYLKNGKILIPASQYEEGARLVEGLKRNQ
jgi:hypothetical protein